MSEAEIYDLFEKYQDQWDEWDGDAVGYKNFVKSIQESRDNILKKLAKVEATLKEALEYYHNDRYSTRAKAMKTRIDEALDILNQTEDD